MRNNLHMLKAKAAKDDEFYTRYEDIEKCINEYKKELINKKIYCNCDDPEWSNFYKYFFNNFDYLNIKSLTCTFLKEVGQAYMLKVENKRGKKILTKKMLKGNGGFETKECENIMKKNDFVITNPPFSRIREFFGQIINNKKKYIFLGNLLSSKDKAIFNEIKNENCFIGKNNVSRFVNTEKTVPCRWYTNILTPPIIKEKTPPYTLEDYQILCIDKLSDFPDDFSGELAVPITFLQQWQREKYEVVRLITPKGKFTKVVIRKKQNNSNNNIV